LVQEEVRDAMLDVLCIVEFRPGVDLEVFMVQDQLTETDTEALAMSGTSMQVKPSLSGDRGFSDMVVCEE
jgi:hypothetical protein